MRNAAVSLWCTLYTCIHVTVHWLVRNTSVRPTRCYDFGILFFHYYAFWLVILWWIYPVKAVIISALTVLHSFVHPLSSYLRDAYKDETVLRGYTAVWQNRSTGIADVSSAIGWTYCSLVVNLGFSHVDVWWDRTLVSEGVKTTKILKQESYQY